MNIQQGLIFARLFLLTAILFCSSTAVAQFPGAVGTANTTAIHKDSNLFIGWATGCTVTRGYLDVSDPGLGLASYGTDNAAIGPADGTDVVSLGDAGTATLTFAQAITDGAGFDFAVFENSFNDNFLELAFVEVSSDGMQFFRFPATSLIQTIDQIGPFDDVTDASELDNLAGKYRAEYGTPFDLAALANSPGLDIHAITHVRIVDAVGSIDHTYATFDQFGTAVNDPFPTPFPSCGFDLDAVGVIHQLPAGVSEKTEADHFVLYPNPVKAGEQLFIANPENLSEILITTIKGEVCFQGTLFAFGEQRLQKGCYLAKLIAKNGSFVQELIVVE